MATHVDNPGKVGVGSWRSSIGGSRCAMDIEDLHLACLASVPLGGGRCQLDEDDVPVKLREKSGRWWLSRIMSDKMS